MANGKKKDSTKEIELTEFSSLRETKANESVPLPQTQQNKSVEPKPLTLDQWVDSIFAEDAKKTNDTSTDEHSNEDYRPTVMLSRFGLHNPIQVKEFLHSPAGEAIIGEIGAHLALEKAIKEEQIQEQQEQSLLMSKLQALLFLWFLEDKAYAAEKIKELVIQENEKAIERAKSPPSAQEAAAQKTKEIDNILSNLYTAKNELETIGAALDKKMARLISEKEHIEIKYGIYDANIIAFEMSLDDGTVLDEAEIERRMKVIFSTIDAHLMEIDMGVYETDQDAEAIKDALTGLNLQLASYHDMLSVLQKEKFFVNAKGEEVSSIKEAQLTLNKDQKLVKDGEDIYLLNAGDDWEKIKREPLAKAAAQAAYEQLKGNPEAMSVKKVIQHNRVQETNLNTSQITETEALRKDNKALLTLTNNQTNLMQAARANVVQQANQPNASQQPPRPIPTPTATPTVSTAPTPKPAQVVSTVQVYKERLEALKQTTNVSREEFINLANQAPGRNKIEAVKYVQKKLADMPRTGNIPFVTMQKMLIEMKKFGIEFGTDPTKKAKPNSAADAQESAAEEKGYVSPSPFNDPYR